MTIKPFFVVFIVLVGAVIYAYYAPQNKPERATTLTPKQYIEMVEKNKAEKNAKAAKTESDSSRQPATSPDQ